MTKGLFESTATEGKVHKHNLTKYRTYRKVYNSQTRAARTHTEPSKNHHHKQSRAYKLLDVSFDKYFSLDFHSQQLTTR